MSTREDGCGLNNYHRSGVEGGEDKVEVIWATLDQERGINKVIVESERAYKVSLTEISSKANANVWLH